MSNAGVRADDFDAYFRALHRHDPYPWQSRLAEQAVDGHWPGAVDLPTGSGKTACIDIAIFATACQASRPPADRTAPRRVFFCVNRRVIVDEACRRAEQIARKVWKAERDGGDSVLTRVAGALRTVAGSSDAARPNVPPLDVIELRGGIYRDNRWARSATQPAVICTTIDQLGSRLLFRGYGVSSGAAPIQAALIAYDSLVLLDEAHISEPFRQTLDRISQYVDAEKWAEAGIGVGPMIVVPMTATPNPDMKKRGVIGLDEDDRCVERLRKRLKASKPATLLSPTKNLAKDASDYAIKCAADKPAAIGIMVNRVATAKRIYDALREERQKAIGGKKSGIEPGATIELVIGSMRPLDRDKQAERLRTLVGPDRPEQTQRTSFVVATQCLEVGADYDFDVLITECASLDALRQRFGRLNRAGRSVETKASILIDKKGVKEESKLDDEKPADPIYGNALARTWKWLSEHATADAAGGDSRKQIDFGIDAFEKLLTEHGDDGRMPDTLLAPSASLNAPVILPAYLDLWCQTAPRPTPDPDVSLFLHGPQRGGPDVQVCWRADLVENSAETRDDWPAIVSLLPPTAAECMSVPISRVRRWLADHENRQADADLGDALEAAGAELGDDEKGSVHHGVLWRGPMESVLIRSAADLRPGDTLVLPASNAASRVLGHLPLPAGDDGHGQREAEFGEQCLPIADIADDAFTLSRDKAALRLHPSLRGMLPGDEAFDSLFRAARNQEPPTAPEWSDLLREAIDELHESNVAHNGLRKKLEHLANGRLRIERYPNDAGVVLLSRERMRSVELLCLEHGHGEDASSQTERASPVRLADHTKHVVEATSRMLAQLPIGPIDEVYEQAARLHDLGKADERFQAVLRGSTRSHAWLRWDDAPRLWAKSPTQRATLAEYRLARERAGLPPGWRHEMLSVQLAEHSAALAEQPAERELMLHLIAAHHGHARPFAPVVPDDELPGVAVEADGLGNDELTHEQRAALVPPHRLDSGIAERFWSLTRRYGWWGLAYLEAVLRLADQQASAAEDAGLYNAEPAEQTTGAMT